MAQKWQNIWKNVSMKEVKNLNGKLDLYKTEFSQGKELLEDQKIAISKYDEVLQSLEVMRELQKNFLQIAQDTAKTMKKQVKREQAERQAHELQRIREILKIQDVLSNMGETTVRNDFLSGENGAVVLSEENLDQLDKLFKLITPSRVSEEGKVAYEEQLSSAPEHLVGLLDGKQKEVLGTMYKDLKELILKIHDCDYFKQSRPEPEADVDSEGDSQICESHFVEVVKEEVSERLEEGDTNEHHIHEEVEEEGEEEEEEDDYEEDETVTRSQLPDTGLVAQGGAAVEDNSVFSTLSLTQKRHYTEVISGSQGSFDFLQESQLEIDSPHMDPAVVAAHPRVPSTVRPFTSSQPVDTFTSQYHHGSEEQTTARVQSPVVVQTSQAAAVYVQPVQQIPAIPPSEFSQITTQTFTNQSYVALQSYETPVYNQGPPQPVTQAVSSSSAVMGLMGSEPVSVVAEPKKHFMNVNATAFESAVTFNSIPNNMTSSESNVTVEDAGDQGHEDEVQYNSQSDSNQGAPGNYPHQSMQGGFQVKGGYNSRGGIRGAGRGARGTTNGYGSRGGGRQGSGGAGGYSNGRPSGNYQGYRDGSNYYQGNYQRDNGGGNQPGYGSSYKRGASSFSSRGGPRGNMRGNLRGNYGKSGQ